MQAQQRDRISIGAEVRLWIAGLLALAAALGLCSAILMPASALSQAAGERQLAAYLGRATVAADAFQRQHGALPDAEQMKAISEQAAQGERVRQFYIANSLNEAAEKLGPIPPGGFVIGYWRGEWEEAYASWSGKNTLQTDYETTLRAFNWVALISACLGFLCGCGAWWIYPSAAMRKANA